MTNISAQESTGGSLAETISVTGVGSVNAAPDMATLRIGVVSEAETAGKALSQNTQSVEALFTTLDRLQIASKDRQTTQFNVSPQYRRDPPQRSPSQQNNEPRIVGYQVTNEVRVRVRQLDGLGELLDAVVTAGANRINGIQFEIEDQDDLLNQARRKAIENARAKAKVLAEAAGANVGRVLSIREHGTSPPPGPRPMMMAAEARSVPIARGEQELTEQYDVTFELRPGAL